MKQTILLLLIIAFISAANATLCMCTSPQDGSCWPSSLEWRLFNNSINGELFFPLPVAASCHVPYYNATECEEIKQVYNNRYWRITTPVGMQQPQTELGVNDNKGCIGTGNPESFCHRGNLPYYVVNATTKVDQVQKTVTFAKRKNLRLVVRNTGHDFFGRSTSQAALSVWLHHMKNISVSNSFREEGCWHHDDDTLAITAGPGVQFFELMDFATQRKLEFVGGSCPSVGLAGYIQGGGHSLLSPRYGLAADNALQFKVVTANGQLKIANKCQNRDLFWALRGGGGGSFGVVVEVTFKVFNATPLFGTVYRFTASNDVVYEKLVNNLLSNVPRWSDAGWAAYFYIYKSRTIVWNALIHDTNTTYALSTLSSFFSFIDSTPGLSRTTLIESTYPNYYPFYQVISAPHDNTIYGNFILGSWLMPRENFVGTRKLNEHTNTILEVLQRNGDYLMMMMVAGGAVAQNGNDVAVNPAWRGALTHSIMTSTFAANITAAQRRAAEQAISDQSKLLANIAPRSGAYFNEADTLQPNWQRAFFGANYPRLKLIKAIYDPSDLFICKKCVGSEDWSDDLKCRRFF